MQIYQVGGGGRRAMAVDRLEDASRRRCDVLSTLHNIALVVNSMTFEQNAAVSPYDGTRRAEGQFFLIRPYISFLSPFFSPLPSQILFLSIVSTRARAYLSGAVTRNELRCCS